MNKRMTLLRTVFIFLISSAGFTISQNSIAFETNFNKTKDKIKPLTILGYQPYIESIGIAIGEYVGIGDERKFVIKDKKATSIQVGDLLFIPRPANQADIPEINKPYQFADIDGDDIAVNTDNTDKMITIEWFILVDEDWDNVEGWHDIDEIKPIETEFIQPLGNNSEQFEGVNVLKVPPDAVGHRIGFTYIPESGTGLPRFGSKMYVWDIGHYFKQNKPEAAGWPCLNNKESINEGNPEPYEPDAIIISRDQIILPDCANPGIKYGENEHVPEDIVIKGNSIIGTIEDLDRGKTTNDVDFDFIVNTRYQATLKFDNGRPFTQEMLDAPGATLQWIAYRLAEGADTDVCNADNIDDRNNPSCFTREEVPALTATVNANGNLVTTYTTQSTNDDAKGNLKNLAPDYSEQGYWLEVEFDDGQG